MMTDFEIYDKGPDFLAKVKDIYVIGEAKFLTDYGGAQNANFEDALRLLKEKEGKAIRIAVLDGVVWIKDSTKMFRTVCELEETALTALLLKDFLEGVKR
ncbi:MAG: type II restriction endonuclease [Candidatus Edwardsbacteria bacterium]